MKQLPTIAKLWNSATARLALSYLAIIMLMSIGFSVVFFNASSRELGRQIPPPSTFGLLNSQNFRQQRFDDFFEDRINEGRHNLLVRLVGLNIIALGAGSVISYYLARRSLEPIEAAMEAQSQFVSDASHELRTPLTAIQATNEVALRRAKLTEADARDIISGNIDEVRRLKDLSDGLLSLARQDKQDIVMVPVSLQTVVSQAMERIIVPAQAKNISVSDEVPDIKALGVEQSLVQAVVILLDNAIKYSNKNKTIHLDASKRGKHAYLRVRDEGIGIRASDIPHVFKRFYRADTSRSKIQREGYGLGLSIADKIVRQHGGEISVTSTPGEGSTFVIKLPLA